MPSRSLLHKLSWDLTEPHSSSQFCVCYTYSETSYVIRFLCHYFLSVDPPFLLVLCQHSGSFSVAMIKHHSQGHLKKEEFTLVYGPRGMSPWRQSQGRVTTGRSWERVSSVRKHDAERANWGRKRIWALKDHPEWGTSFSKDAPLKCPQTATPTGDQVFQYRSLWGTFLFKPLQL